MLGNMEDENASILSHVSIGTNDLAHSCEIPTDTRSKLPSSTPRLASMH